jgi:NADH-quinone oxidoreductase subunit L
MTIGPDKIWLIPLLPLVAAAILSFSRSRALANICSIGAMFGAFVLSIFAFSKTLESPRTFWNFPWLEFGSSSLELGFLLDPVTASMLLMVTFVGLLIFIYSTGYMAQDENYARFFCFLCLFAAGMLGVIVANSLLLLFICWEVVGLASYLLIGFWFFKPSAAAAAKKAFITTRIGDIGFFLGMIWLYSETGTLLFYEAGQQGCLENAALNSLVAKGTALGLGAATAISLLIFCGAIGKSGQVPLHVWLPDAMEGPTPVSALIHAATMVAAGVFLVARVYPLMDADVSNVPGYSAALSVVTWIGAITAIFAALIAVAQNDIKRILAYSTVSQLGYMMMGLGVGGVFVGMFHLLTHAFFKALLFLGAGSVIHGAHEEQDITRMGGLRRTMPVTFATYAIGMMALAGVPFLFSGFWSKDEILHSASIWERSKIPFFLGLAGAFLTAFYMTRQMFYVFFGESRLEGKPHESPAVMTVPLLILAACTILLGFLGTPAWPWLHHYLTGEGTDGGVSALFKPSFMVLAFLSSLIVGAGIAAGWYLYRRFSSVDPLDAHSPGLFASLRSRLWIDEIYESSVIRFTKFLGFSSARLETTFFRSTGRVAALLAIGLGWFSRLFDNLIINSAFDRGCRALTDAARSGARVQNGQVQTYLRAIALTFTVLVLLLAWGCKGI